MYSVTVNLERGYFEVATHGFWTLDTLGDFARELEQTVRRIRAAGRTPVSLCDLTNAMVQSQEVVAAFARMMQNPAVRSGRVAVYTSGALTKFQAVRANEDHDEFRFFTCKDEARAWLFAPQGEVGGRRLTSPQPPPPFALSEVEVHAPKQAARDSLGLRLRSG
ncbi:STAS/SEC14 domain-containing protein [Sphingomonas sp. Leaf257]|uniref:STAS/SEC14 domain-containing protein n=1 Tax=Sphingomonas sp. Leaf257 TaxID=1736309 RepID=UPI000ACF93C4|nr:STAS/SEC14 domain-containing protein [Sphingomonas sp. Leaf257]